MAGEKEGFEKRLEGLRKEIEEAGFTLTASWVDEYGGVQSVSMGGGDKLSLRENVQRSV